MTLKNNKILLIIITTIGLITFSCSSDDSANGLIDNLDVETYDFTTQPCVSGMSDIYPCNDYDLLLQIPLSLFDATEANDSWGWTDPTTNREYAILGLNNGTAFIDVTNPNEAIYLGKLPTATVNSSWRDIKVYNNYAFIVSEAADHGMQVFDLSKLRDLTDLPKVFASDAHYTGFGSAHNIVINEEIAVAYILGADDYQGGPIFLNIQNPTSPVDEGGYSADGYCHDAQVITYHGPDADYFGKEIFIGSNGGEIVIIDVTDVANPVSISQTSYPNVGYAHQGWMTENHQYYIAGDESDEINFSINTRTLVFDFTDLDAPFLKMTYSGPSMAIDHNGYIRDNIFYLANYTAGVRFIDISNVANNVMSEVGFFDTSPDNNDSTEFNGAWNVYPYLESKNIVISDINRGLFIVKKSNP